MEQICFEFGDDSLLGQICAVLVEHLKVKEQLVVALCVDILTDFVLFQELLKTGLQASLLADLEELLNELPLVADGVSLPFCGGYHVGVDVNGLCFAVGIQLLVGLGVLVVFPLSDFFDLPHDGGLTRVERNDVVDVIVFHGRADLGVVNAHQNGSDVGIPSHYLFECRIVEVNAFHGVISQHRFSVHHYVSQVALGNQRQVSFCLGVLHEERKARHLCVELDFDAHGRTVLHGLDDVQQMELFKVREGEDAQTTEIVDLLDSCAVILEDLPLVFRLACQKSGGCHTSRVVEASPCAKNVGMLSLKLFHALHRGQIRDGRQVVALFDEVHGVGLSLVVGLVLLVLGVTEGFAVTAPP